MLILAYYFMDLKFNEVGVYSFALLAGIFNTVGDFYFPVYRSSKNDEA
jgi:hypothetical protein